MELFHELLLTAFFAFFLSLLVTKLVSNASRKTGVVSEGEVTAQRIDMESKKGVELVEGGVEKVAKFQGEKGKMDEFDHDANGVSGEEIVGGDGDSFKGSRIISKNLEKDGVDDNKVNLGRKNHVFDDQVGDEIVKEIGGDGDSFGCSRVIGENIEKDGVDDNRVNLGRNDHVVDDQVDGEIVKEVGGDGDSFGCSRVVGENLEKDGVDDNRVNLGRNDHVVDDQVDGEIVKEVGGDGDSFGCSRVVGENIEKDGVDDNRVNLGRNDHVVDDQVDGEIVKEVGGDGDSFECSGAVCENIENIGVEGEIFEGSRVVGENLEKDGVDYNRVNFGRNDHVVDDQADDEIVKKVGGDGDSFEYSGAACENIENIGVEGDIIVNLGRNVHVVDDQVARVYEEKIVEHLMVNNEIVEDVWGDGDSFVSSGELGENIEKTEDDADIRANLRRNDSIIDDQVDGVSEEKIVDPLTLDNEIVENVEGDGGTFECTGVVGENIEIVGGEGEFRVNLGRSDTDVDDEVAAEERNEGMKMEEFDERVRTGGDIFESSGASDENNESIGVDGDITLKLGRKDPVVNEVVVEEKGEGRKLEGFEHTTVEHVVENVSSKNSGANVESAENVGVGGDIKLMIDDDDDWEGIERSELEENFGAAANYVFRVDKNVCEPKLDSDVKMELYGLNKIVLEGPCRKPQPMAIMVSARAKWNAWQRLGNMSPEIAMEQYISLLSDRAPQWMESKSSGDGSKDTSTVSEASPPDIGTYPKNQLNPINERVFELNSAINEDDLTGGSLLVNKI